jgi:hypothetical protein
MSIILGFGSVETRVRAEIIEHIRIEMSKGKDIQSISKEYNSVGDAYDKLSKEDAPEIYTKFFFYDDTLHFHHINRRHAFSPDGWALMCCDEPMESK